MKLAETIKIVVGGEAIELRPCLRFAMRLERREGSFAKLMRDVAEESLSAACEIIGDHLDLTPEMQRAVFDALPDLKWPLVTYVGQCTGIDQEDIPAEGKAKGESITFAEHLAGLYRIGTGWLGWTPAQTLDSTPAEIKQAYRGRLEMLKAIFGSGKEDKPAKDERPLDEKFRGIFASMGTVKEEA